MWFVGSFACACARFREAAALRPIAGALTVRASERPLSGPASISRRLFSTCAGFEQESSAHTRTDWAMSVSSEVQRTLVKSPPELWAELSDPAALARHLGELGEIRITRVEPEKTVEWEAADTTGAVRLKPSGWGTRVTLTASREIPAPEPVAAPAPEPEPEPEPEPVAEPAPEPRRGLFARLFSRRPKVAPAAELEPSAPVAEPPDVSAEQQAAAALAAELAMLEEALIAETQAVLTSVLDRLGAAHHRPFSRS
jgi:hypothetical protein